MIILFRFLSLFPPTLFCCFFFLSWASQEQRVSYFLLSGVFFIQPFFFLFQIPIKKKKKKMKAPSSETGGPLWPFYFSYSFLVVSCLLGSCCCCYWTLKKQDPVFFFLFFLPPIEGQRHSRALDAFAQEVTHRACVCLWLSFSILFYFICYVQTRFVRSPFRPSTSAVCVAREG